MTCRQFLVFERSKTGDIVQGLPRIEEILEARRPKEACKLAQRPGKIRVWYDSEENSHVEILETDGITNEYMNEQWTKSNSIQWRKHTTSRTHNRWSSKSS